MGRSRKKLYSNILSIAIIPFLGLIGWLIGAYLGGNYAVGIKFILHEIPRSLLCGFQALAKSVPRRGKIL